MEIKLSTNGARPTGALAGSVVDARGEPIGGALVRAVAVDRPGLGPTPSIEVVASDDGRFAIANLRQRRYLISAVAEGHARADLRTEPDNKSLVIALRDAAVIRGRVIDADGAPVPSFTVSASSVTGALERGPGTTVSIFDGDGGFELSSLAPGKYAVVATAAGHATSREVLVEATNPAGAAISISLARGGTLVGVVVDEASGEPLEGARVSTESRIGIGSTATPAIASVVTAADGGFALPGLPAGKASVNVAAFAHHAKIVTGISVPDGGQVGPMKIELAPVKKGEKPKTEFAGIGCAIGAADDGFRVSRVFPKSGCAEAGLMIDDVIVAVEGVKVVDLGFEPALQRLRGPEGTRVTVSLRRADSEMDVAITRRKITL